MTRQSLKRPSGLVLPLLLAGCAATVDWRYYAPFRVMGQERAVSPVDPAEVHYAGVATNLHYISLSVDAVFYRNIPGTIGREVALGINVAGAIPNRDLKVVSEPVAARGPQGLLFFERPLAIDPFLYRGLPLRITLTFRDVGPDESRNLRGRLSSLGLLGGAHKLMPGADEKLNLFSSQFEAFLGKAHKDKLFTYGFTLYPSSTEGVRQEMVVTGGRHVFIAIPGADAPGFIQKVKPADLIYKLRLAGRRLEWRHDGREYTESPYIIVSVIRYKRYPSEDIPLRKAVKDVDRMIEQGNWEMARSNLPNIGAALLEEKSITQMEKNLEQAWKDVRAARIDAGVAAKQGDKEGRLEAMLREVKLLGYIAKDFQQILEPFEVKDIQFQVRRLTRQVTELAAELSKPSEPIAAVTREAEGSIKPPPEPPANPILTLKPPDVVTVTVTKPEPFYKKWWFYTLVGVAAAGVLSGGTYYGVTQGGGPPLTFRIPVRQ